MSDKIQKIIFCGLDNGGKSSILLLLDKKFSLLNSIKPTIKAKRVPKSISLLGLQISNWDLGGQKSFRESYLKNKEKYFSHVQSVLYVIDIQSKDRFEEVMQYLTEIVNIVLELNPNYSQFFILFHKYDPDIRNKKEIKDNIINLKKRIKNINSNVKFSFYNTSIYEESSLLKSFSDGAIAVTSKSLQIQTLLKEYTTKTFSSAAILLDQQSFIIASRSTKESYQEICESVAPRLAYAMEKLEDWGIDTIDIVTNIQFPQEDSTTSKEGLIFLRKIDVSENRLYLIALCLNKKVKIKSYEYLPILAENLKTLLASFE